MSRTRLIGLFALAKLLLHFATSSGYGYFRDEFYYLACTEHLAPGYVDHPSLSIFVLWVVRHLLGDSLPALRLLPAVLGAATVALVGLMARALGGGRWAVALAMTAALVAPEYLALDHFYSMNAFDIFFWALAACLLIRLIDGANPRLWPLLGLVLGLGLANKISGHNNYWFWGPRGWDGRVLIVIGDAEERLRALFDSVERSATIECGRCMPYENRQPVWVCRGLRAPVAESWALLKHFD